MRSPYSCNQIILYSIIYFYTIYRGEEDEVCAVKKNYLVDNKFFDIFILMCKPILKLNINYFDSNSRIKLSYVLSNCENFIHL